MVEAFAALINPKNPAAAISAKEVQAAARALAKDIHIDTIAVLDFGRKIAEGPPTTVRENPAVIAAYLGVGHA